MKKLKMFGTTEFSFLPVAFVYVVLLKLGGFSVERYEPMGWAWIYSKEIPGNDTIHGQILVK